MEGLESLECTMYIYNNPDPVFPVGERFCFRFRFRKLHLRSHCNALPFIGPPMAPRRGACPTLAPAPSRWEGCRSRRIALAIRRKAQDVLRLAIRLALSPALSRRGKGGAGGKGEARRVSFLPPAALRCHDVRDVCYTWVL